MRIWSRSTALALAAGALAVAPVSAAAAPKVKVASSDYGKILVDGKGFTLYGFTADGRRSACHSACSDAWPPLIAHGEPRAASGARKNRLGTVKRKGGQRQVTYDGKPLYYYVGETSPGQVLCQAAVEYGGTWLVLNRRGEYVH